MRNIDERSIYRKFGDVYYTYRTFGATKKIANDLAKGLRAKGELVRVVKYSARWGTRYEIYVK